MRVGLVSPYDLSKPGGVQAQVLGLADTIGTDAYVIGPGLPADVAGLDLGDSVSVPGNGSMAPISLSLRLKRQIADAPVDVLHVHEPLMPTVSWSALRAGKPVVATFHADPSGAVAAGYRFISGYLRRLLGPNVKAVSAVSRTAGRVLEGVDYQLVPNGLDVGTYERGLDRVPKSVSFLGRDEPRKGLDILIEAWPTVLAAHPDASLRVMGGRRDLDGVEFLGRVDDETKAGVLNSSDIYVAPNTGGESFGIVLVEGMAAGAAVVCSDLPAFKDVGSDVVQYFETGSSVDLARSVIELMNDAELTARLGRAGQEHSKQFSWDVVAARYQELYESVLS